MRRLPWLVLLLLPLATRPADGQRANRGSTGGSCHVGASFECLYRAFTEERPDQQYESLHFVVVWRVPPGAHDVRSMGDTLLRSVVQQAYRSEVRAAEDRGRSHMGGSGGSYWYGASVNQRFAPGRPGADSLFVHGEAFSLPADDSLLVVLVEGANSPSGEAPRIVGTVRVASTARGTGRRRWTSGDTTFFVNPRRGRTDWIGDALREIPEVREFLDRPTR
jgi:hypothetical protein